MTVGKPEYSTFNQMAIQKSPLAGVEPYDVSSFDAATAMEYVSEDVKKRQTHIQPRGIRGSRSVSEDRVRIGSEPVGGPIDFNATPVELVLIYELIMGDVSGTTFSLTDDIPEFNVLIDRGINRFGYTGCYASRLTISGSQPGNAINYRLDVEGKKEFVDATAFPLGPNDVDGGPIFTFNDVTISLSVEGDATELSAFNLVIDNVLDTSRFNNSVSRSQICPRDRIISLGLQTPYTDCEDGLYDQLIAGGAGSLTLTYLGYSTTFTFANLKVPAESPTNNQRADEVTLPINARAYATDVAAQNELIITHDSTP